MGYTYTPVYVPTDASAVSMAAANQVTDSPSENAESVGNFATLNSAYREGSGYNVPLSNGNLTYANSGFGRVSSAIGTIGVSSGKFYWEATWSAASPYLSSRVGIAQVEDRAANPDGGSSLYLGRTAGSWSFAAWASGANAGKKETGASFSSYYDTAVALSDKVGVAFDADNGAIWISVNGSWVDGSGGGQSSSTVLASIESYASTYVMFSGLTDGPYVPVFTWDGSDGTGAVNFGQTAFHYTPPTGFKALNTANLSTPTVTATSAYYQTKVYTGNGSSNAVTFSGNSNMQPDFVWIKDRDEADSHALFDSVRGVQKYMQVNNAGTEQSSSSGITSFDSNGFTIGGDLNPINSSGDSFVAWSMKAGGAPTASDTGGASRSGAMATDSVFKGGSDFSFTPASGAYYPKQMSIADHRGFSIVTWTGDGTNSDTTFPHGLDGAPEFVITKNIDLSTDWLCKHKDDGYSDGTNLRLNEASSNTPANSGYLKAAGLTSDTFEFDEGDTNANNFRNNNEVYMAYCFKRVSGLIGIGKYTGNGSTDGPVVVVDDGGSGFKPAFVLIKAADRSNNWHIFDSARSPYNQITNDALFPDLALAEGGTNAIDFLSNGFKLRTDQVWLNASSSNNYIYLAFAETPFALNNRAR